MRAPTKPAPVLKVLLLLPYEPAAFMQADVEILGRHFDLDVVVHNRGKRHLFMGVLRRLLFERPDVLLMWFIVPSYALAVTLMARLLGVRVAFMTGGYDIVGIPRIGFGAMRFPLFRFMMRPTLALTHAVFPFSRSAAEQLRRYGRPRMIRVLYPGVDTRFFTPPNGADREPLALTVSPITESSIPQKGLKSFVEAARHALEMRWVLVGRSPDGSIDTLRRVAGPNVEFVDRFLPAEELLELYRRASCYVQASAHEGFGVAVAEAMACGTVPVTTRRYSLPEVAGGLGAYIPLDDSSATAAAALRTLNATPELRRKLRARIEENFPRERRERELVDHLLKLAPARGRLDAGWNRKPSG
jgi:glycosyltransferase involved in cell wall biosynthesis